MNTLAFDGRMGASGDMLLGALLAVGADRDVLEPVESALPVRYHIGSATKCGIAATDVSVQSTKPSDEGSGHPQHADHSEHDHGPEHQDDHSQNHRSYEAVIEIVDGMDLPGSADQVARDAITRLGEAEAEIHGTDLESIHFHEVGTDDAIADIVGTALLLEDIDPDRVVTTPLSTGGGTVSMSHGTYPVPTPAVVKIASEADWTLRGGPIDQELLTPTGAAILATIADGVQSLPELAVERSGYGAGDRSHDQYSNVLRAIAGQSSGGLERESVTVLETNLDDATPEVLGSLQETLIEAGALDVSILPATMKKSRPGHIVKVVVAPEDARQVAKCLAIETGTLGIREHGRGHRFVASRETETVPIDLDGRSVEVAVKVASIDGEVFDISAEYDDVNRIADTYDLPIRTIRRRAEMAMQERLADDPDA